MAGAQKYAAYQYACPARSEGRECIGVSIKADEADWWITEGYFLGYFGEQEWKEKRVIPTGEIELDEIERSIRATTSAMNSPDADIPALVARLEILRKQREEIEPKAATTEWVSTGRTLREYWDSAELAERQRILRVAIKAVYVTKTSEIPKGRRHLVAVRTRVEWQDDFWMDDQEFTTPMTEIN